MQVGKVAALAHLGRVLRRLQRIFAHVSVEQPQPRIAVVVVAHRLVGVQHRLRRRARRRVVLRHQVSTLLLLQQIVVLRLLRQPRSQHRQPSRAVVLHRIRLTREDQRGQRVRIFLQQPLGRGQRDLRLLRSHARRRQQQIEVRLPLSAGLLAVDRNLREIRLRVHRPRQQRDRRQAHRRRRVRIRLGAVYRPEARQQRPGQVIVLALAMHQPALPVQHRLRLLRIAARERVQHSNAHRPKVAIIGHHAVRSVLAHHIVVAGIAGRRFGQDRVPRGVVALRGIGHAAADHIQQHRLGRVALVRHHPQQTHARHILLYVVFERRIRRVSLARQRLPHVGLGQRSSQDAHRDRLHRSRGIARRQRSQ